MGFLFQAPGTLPGIVPTVGNEPFIILSCREEFADRIIPFPQQTLDTTEYHLPGTPLPRLKNQRNESL